ncbi:hypothetical protein Avbf_06971 [Armadillidium vulgare]|nr:hypothetical protein Avbf_06971 [Armadillidium vulgare]
MRLMGRVEITWRKWKEEGSQDKEWCSLRIVCLSKEHKSNVKWALCNSKEESLPIMLTISWTFALSGKHMIIFRLKSRSSPIKS